METAAAGRALELAGPLRDLLPPVDFCCAYGSTLLHARPDGTSMVDYILGVADPLQWHSENLERNPDHYASWIGHRGPGAVTWLADRVGVGVYFNPFVQWRDKRIKYGVVGMKDLAMDLLSWDRFYLSGRLQKPVHVLVDNWDIRKVNMLNLKMATSASLLLLPEEFTEYDLYAQICSLSYMGDLRMLFAEDKDKVKKIVEGSFQPFQLMYRPLLQEYISEGILKTSVHGQQKAFKQDCGVPATNELFSSLPWIIQRKLQGRFPSNSKGSNASCVDVSIFVPEILADFLMKDILPRNANPYCRFFKRYGIKICPHGFEAPGNGFECTPSSVRTACLRWCSCRAISREENVKGLEIKNILSYRHYVKFELCLVVTEGLPLSFTGNV